MPKPQKYTLSGMLNHPPEGKVLLLTILAVDPQDWDESTKYVVERYNRKLWIGGVRQVAYPSK